MTSESTFGMGFGRHLHRRYCVEELSCKLGNWRLGGESLVVGCGVRAFVCSAAYGLRSQRMVVGMRAGVVVLIGSLAHDRKKVSRSVEGCFLMDRPVLVRAKDGAVV